MRSVHSIMNRSPPHLIKEIILVNDFSSKKFLWGDLKLYLREHFEGKARVVDLNERSGLIKARLGNLIVFGILKKLTEYFSIF
jgi:polypeptide N-acetylgalactosaminyltransferase